MNSILDQLTIVITFIPYHQGSEAQLRNYLIFTAQFILVLFLLFVKLQKTIEFKGTKNSVGLFKMPNSKALLQTSVKKYL